MLQSLPLTARTPAERFDVFKGMIDHTFCPMELDAPRALRLAFEARIDTARLGNLQVVRVSSGPLSVRRRPQDIARIAEPPYLVKFQVKGESLWCQRGAQTHLGPGDFVICSTAEPYSLLFSAEYETLVVVLPEPVMRRVISNPDQFLGRRFSASDADCGLLTNFVADAFARASRLTDQVAQRVEENVLDLLGAVLGARAQPGRLTRGQLLAQIKSYIQTNLHDRNLSPASIGTAFGLSARSVHSLFSSEPMTVARFTRALRIARCRELLDSGARGGALLTDIALRCGFYDLSHMTRCFHEEFGEPPRQYLLRQRAG
jgi:AraC-like DNA-binding protein